MELKNGISTYCPHCDEPFTMYPFGQEVIDSTEAEALRQRVSELEESIKFAVNEMLRYRSGAQANLIAAENRLLIEVTGLTAEARAELKAQLSK